MELNKIYNENCLDTMKRMPNNFIDLTVTSPPYDNLRDYKGYSFDFENIAKELYRITKEGGVVVWVVGDATINGSETGTSFKQALYFKEIGFNLHDTMIWLKSNPIPTDWKCHRYYNSFEYMFVLSKDKPKTCNYIRVKSMTGGRLFPLSNRQKNPDGSKRLDRIEKLKGTVVNDTKIKSNVWEYMIGSSVSSDSISFQHPAIFPEQLANDHIISWSNENDLVYDPFMGSGTTAKVCITNKRNYIGSEISSEYCEIIKKRLSSVSETLF